MSKAVSMSAGGVSFLVETDDAVELPAGFKPARSPDREGVPSGFEPMSSAGQLERQFAEVQSLIVTCCNSLYESLERLPHPEKVSVEFGVKLGGEVGVPMLTKASGEANFKVSVEWKPPPRPQP